MIKEGIMFALICLLFLALWSVPNDGIADAQIETKPCPPPETEVTCYKYMPRGGIFGGVSKVKVGCEEAHDYYINRSVHTGDFVVFSRCPSVYEKIYGEYEG